MLAIVVARTELAAARDIFRLECSVLTAAANSVGIDNLSLDLLKTSKAIEIIAVANEREFQLRKCTHSRTGQLTLDFPWRRVFEQVER